MKIPRTQLAEVIAEKTLKVRSLPTLAREVAAYLLLENRVAELEPLMRDVLAYRESRGIVEANVISAHDLSVGVEREVSSILHKHFPEAKHVVTSQSQDPDLIGGLKVQLSNDQLDLSIRAKLNKFQRLTAQGVK